MPRSIELPPALIALAQAAWALAARAPSARVALARVAGLVDAEALPREIRDGVTAELHAAAEEVCEPLAADVVERALANAWGRPPDEVLDELDPEPLAVRAGAQTHRALAEGVPVAVRVRRPGLERAVRSDLALLEALSAPLTAVLPRAEVAGLLRAVREQALDELDFEHEASTHRRVARALRGVEGLVVPRVHGDLCADDVFVAGLLDGRALADGALAQDRGAAARALVRAHLAAAASGVALLDARPGHVIALADGRIGLLGVGVARPIARERVAQAVAAVASLRAADADAFARAVAGTELLTAADARDAYEPARAVLGRLAEGPARLDASELRDLTARAADAAPAIFALLPRARPRPDDIWVARAAGQLVATLARLGVTTDWPQLVASSAPR